ncbi:MAG: sporulation protein, partial [Ruminococcus sp.]|nr:sporulation protein [Ruminococcus sp.]
MKVQTMLKRAAAVASGVLVLSATVSMNTVDSSSTAEDTTAAETSATESETAAETETASEEAAENAEEKSDMPEDWDKADVSDYDSSLTLISYELATPEMAKVGEAVDPYAGLSEEER